MKHIPGKLLAVLLVLALALPAPLSAFTGFRTVVFAEEDTGDPPEAEAREEAQEDILPAMPEAPVRPDYPAFEQSCTVDGVVVSVSAPAGAFPEGSALSVSKAGSDKLLEAEEAVGEERGGGNKVAASYTFDIRVLDPVTGEEFQPAGGLGVKVSFSLPESEDKNLTTNVYHITENKAGHMNAEKLESKTESGEVTADSDGFSFYTVEFTYEDLEYVLSGDESVPLSEVLEAIGLSGDVTDAEVSNESLFSVSKAHGEWIVTANRAFTTP